MSRAASDSRWTPATLAKRLPFKSWFIHGHKKKKVARREVGTAGRRGRRDTTTILFCSQKRGFCWRCSRFNENRWRPLTEFPLMVVDNVYSRGSGAGIAACSHRGSALKRTKVSNLYEYFKHSVLTIPGIFGLPLVHSLRISPPPAVKNCGCARDTIHNSYLITSQQRHHRPDYSYALHNDVSVNDGPHIRRRSHNIIIL